MMIVTARRGRSRPILLLVAGLLVPLAAPADPCMAQDGPSGESRPDPWALIASHFSPPKEWEGQLGVYDRLDKFFPDAPEDKAGITLHQLMTHTAGMVEYTDGDYTATPRDEAVQVAMQGQLLFAPGTSFSYSNAGYTVLAAVVERASGRPYEDYLREKLFLPAGMEHTGYRGPDWESVTVSRQYTGDRDNGTPLEKDYPYWNLLGNGGMLATSGDMLRWHRALMGEEILSAEAKEKLYSPELNNYAYGWDSLNTPYGRLITHNGGNDFGATADYLRYTDRDVVIFYASNRALDDLPIHYMVRNAVVKLAFGEPFQPFPAAADGAPDPKQLEGTYLLPSGESVNAMVRRGRLMLAPAGQGAINAILGFEGEDAIRYSELTNRADGVVGAALSGDFGSLRDSLADPSDLDGFRSWLEQAIGRLGEVSGYRVFGTIPAWWSSNADIATFAEMTGDKSAVLFRFHWDERGIWGLGGRAIPRPVLIVCMPQAEGGFIGYDPGFGLQVPVRFEEVEGRSLLAIGSGDAELTAERAN